MYHYLSYNTIEEAKSAQKLARRHLGVVQDQLSGASEQPSDLYLAGNYWYVFRTQRFIPFDQVKQFVSAVPTCGHVLNCAQECW
jgi:hypothetical protein